MTQPHQFTTATPSDQVQRDSSSYIPMARCRGKLLIVRPLKYQQEGFVTIHKPLGTDAVFADIAVLDPINVAQDKYGDPLPGFAAGHQFRDQVVLQGYLKGTFKRYIGSTLIGTIYFGPKEKGEPPMMWQDLSQDGQCVARGQSFLAACPEFLVPTNASFTQPEPPAPQGPPAYVPPQDPTNNVGYSSPSYGQDPWAQQQRPVSSPPPQQAPPQQAANTLEQMRQWREQQQRQEPAPPF